MTVPTLAHHGTLLKSDGNGTFAPESKITPANAFVGVSISGSPVVNVIGFDPIGGTVGRLYAVDKSFGGLAMTDDFFATSWQNSKSLPSNVANGQIFVIVRAGANVVALAKDTTSGLPGCYSSPNPVAATNDFVWGVQLKTCVTGTVAKGTEFCVTAAGVILMGEYGDPVGGPHIYRSADGGGTWTTVFNDAGVRHVHAIAEDPYNLGTIYATLGDNGTTRSMIYSTDGGVTWSTFLSSPPDNRWQSLLMSFDAKWIYLASDRIGRSVAVVDRSGSAKVASTNWHRNIAVPTTAPGTPTVDQVNAQLSSVSVSGTDKAGRISFTTSATPPSSGSVLLRLVFGTTAVVAPVVVSSVSNGQIGAIGSYQSSTTSVKFVNGTALNASAAYTLDYIANTAPDEFYTVSYMGLVDPASGFYYLIANDTSSEGTLAGLFYMPSVGTDLRLIAKLGVNENGRPWIAGGKLWFGDGYIPLLEPA